MPEKNARFTADTVRQIARLAGIHPEEERLGSLAASLELMVASIEGCDALDLAEHEPVTTLRLSGGAADAEL